MFLKLSPISFRKPNERVDEPLLSGANLSFLRKWDYARTLRYGGGVMHSSIHFDLTANLIVQLHGKRDVLVAPELRHTYRGK